MAAAGAICLRGRRRPAAAALRWADRAALCAEDPELRSKKDLILNFIDSINPKSVVDDEWKAYVRKSQEEELSTIITEEKLKEDETLRLIDNSFRDGGA